ncbi:Complement factor B, partial [Ophiophagus hannah]
MEGRVKLEPVRIELLAVGRCGLVGVAGEGYCKISSQMWYLPVLRTTQNFRYQFSRSGQNLLNTISANDYEWWNWRELELGLDRTCGKIDCVRIPASRPHVSAGLEVNVLRPALTWVPVEFENGVFEISQQFYEINQKLKFTCYDGHKLRGPQIRTCLPTGKWSGETAPIVLMSSRDQTGSLRCSAVGPTCPYSPLSPEFGAQLFCAAQKSAARQLLKRPGSCRLAGGELERFCTCTKCAFGAHACKVYVRVQSVPTKPHPPNRWQLAVSRSKPAVLHSNHRTTLAIVLTQEFRLALKNTARSIKQGARSATSVLEGCLLSDLRKEFAKNQEFGVEQNQNVEVSK